jgi:hypothetical protein
MVLTRSCDRFLVIAGNEAFLVFGLTCCLDIEGGHAVAQWLRHYATNRKVAGSVTDDANF